MRNGIGRRYQAGLLGLVMMAAQLLPDERAGRAATAGLASLEASPGVVVLDGPHSYVQLLLTGIHEDGARLDVTRDAHLVEAVDLVAIDDRGLVRPLRDGEGELAFEFGGRRITVPVRVGKQLGTLRPSFVRDVMPILSRRGCNAGTCHGSAEGKNGFKLSLRGYDAAFDHNALTDDLAGRRFNRASAEQSLFLLKPTGSVPHEGGRRLTPDDADYAVLKSWVRSGVEFDAGAAKVASIDLQPEKPTVAEPGTSQQFRVVATYADGVVRDVTAHAFFETSDLEVTTVDEHGLATTLRRGDAAILARFEGRYAATRLFVMGDRAGFEWRDVPETNYVDSLVYRRLREIKTLPAELCTDAEFARRVYIDLTGLPPTRKEVRTFLLDRRVTATKRNELIDRLLGSAAFVEHWTNRWASLLLVNSDYLGAEGAEVLREWIRGRVASNAPYDEFVRELLTASGSTLENPPAAYYKIQRVPDLAMENTTQLFLGVRFNCNKCHDHPFERWTKSQHWQMASLFAQVDRKDAPGSKKMAKRTVMEAESPPAYEELIGDSAAGDAVDPDGHVYEPAFPYQHRDEIDATAPRRVQLAQWLTSPDNAYFARSYVNRLWSYFLGVGLIDPVDDIRASNPPTFPELLDRLTEDFVDGGFDARRMMRLICQSRVYQHSIEANRWNEDDKLHYARAQARRLPAEVLFDAIHQATGSRSRLPGVSPGTEARELVDASVKVDDGFLDLFGRPPRESACECERNDGMSLGQALNLVNGPTVADAISDPDNHIAHLVAHEGDPARIATDLYLGFLCRPPSDAELAKLRDLFDAGAPANQAALTPTEQAELDRRFAAWQEKNAPATWHAAKHGNPKSEGGAELSVLEDGSVLASGPAPDKDRYTVVLSTDLTGITGLRLEVEAHESLPAQGPGRAENGNFVLGRLGVTAVPRRDPTKAVVVELTAATADFSQDDFSVAESLTDSPRGWAVSPHLGRPHVAVFETKQDLGADGGTLLIVDMDQPYGGTHTIGRFRWSVTSSQRPVRLSPLTPQLAAILAKPSDQRTGDEHAALYRRYLETDPEMAGKIRLGAAQDLAWSLANSSAFLFNR